MSKFTKCVFIPNVSSFINIRVDMRGNELMYTMEVNYKTPEDLAKLARFKEHTFDKLEAVSVSKDPYLRDFIEEFVSIVSGGSADKRPDTRPERPDTRQSRPERSERPDTRQSRPERSSGASGAIGPRSDTRPVRSVGPTSNSKYAGGVKNVSKYDSSLRKNGDAKSIAQDDKKEKKRLKKEAKRLKALPPKMPALPQEELDDIRSRFAISPNKPVPDVVDPKNRRRMINFVGNLTHGKLSPDEVKGIAYWLCVDAPVAAIEVEAVEAADIEVEAAATADVDAVPASVYIPVEAEPAGVVECAATVDIEISAIADLSGSHC
jgi:hypothetical protein